MLTPNPSRADAHSDLPRAALLDRTSCLLVGFLLIVHVPLAFNNGLFGDDWLMFEVKPGYQTLISFLLHGAGHPITYLYCAMANLTGYPMLFMNGLALAGIAIGALSLRSFLIHLRILSEFETSCVVFLVWTYAGFRDWATKITAPYIFSFALLCLGLNLFAGIANSRRPSVGLRLVSLVAIFCSFAINSMIVVYFVGLLAGIWLIKSDEGRKQPIANRLAQSAKRFADYLAVPFVYWVSTNYFFPKIGPYRDYYLIRVPALDDTLVQLRQFVRWGTYEPFLNAIELAAQSRLPAILSLVAGVAFVSLALWQSRIAASRSRTSPRDLIWPAVAGIMLFVVCALPYISVGISPTGHFYESRHLILFGIPLGFILVSILRVVQHASSKFVSYAVCALVLSANLCSLWNSYFFQQARWIRQSAMIEQLQRSYREPPAAVFNLVDGFLDYPGNTYYGISEITGALHVAWDNRPLFGFTGRNERPTVLQEIDQAMRMDGSAFRNMDLRGPQATIEFVPKAPVLNNYELSTRYYGCLIRFCDRQEFLDAEASTSVRIGPIPDIVPLDGKAAP
ncbi:hypothetical protein ACVWZ4_004781 [Bradyrhizobium sp. USDA 4472]